MTLRKRFKAIALLLLLTQPDKYAVNAQREIVLDGSEVRRLPATAKDEIVFDGSEVRRLVPTGVKRKAGISKTIRTACKQKCPQGNKAACEINCDKCIDKCDDGPESQRNACDLECNKHHK